MRLTRDSLGYLSYCFRSPPFLRDAAAIKVEGAHPSLGMNQPTSNENSDPHLPMGNRLTIPLLNWPIHHRTKRVNLYPSRYSNTL